MSKNRFMSIRSQILNWEWPEGLIRIYLLKSIKYMCYYVKMNICGINIWSINVWM